MNSVAKKRATKSKICLKIVIYKKNPCHRQDFFVAGEGPEPSTSGL